MSMNKIVPSPLVRKFENYVQRSKALDLGAGRGNNAIFLAKQGFSVVAVEIRKDLSDIIKKRAEENKVSVEVKNQDLRDFIIEKNQYSFISAINSLNFFSKKEFCNIINKMKSGLIKEGVCVISIFTTDDPVYKEMGLKAIIKKGGNLINEHGKKRYFPKPNELKKIFKDFETLFYIEAVVDDKGHPHNEYPHKHVVARIAAKKIKALKI